MNFIEPLCTGGWWSWRERLAGHQFSKVLLKIKYLTTLFNSTINPKGVRFGVMDG